MTEHSVQAVPVPEARKSPFLGLPGGVKPQSFSSNTRAAGLGPQHLRVAVSDEAKLVAERQQLNERVDVLRATKVALQGEARPGVSVEREVSFGVALRIARWEFHFIFTVFPD